MPTNETNLEPNYGVLRERFSREARDRAETILANLLPEDLIAPEHIKAVQLSVLTEMNSLLNAIDLVTQCTVNLEQVLALRELTHHCAQTIGKKSNEIERAMEDGDKEVCRTCGRDASEIDLTHDEETGETECTDCRAQRLALEEESEASSEPEEPEEGDWVTQDHINWTQHGYPHAWRDRVIVAEDLDWREILKARMDKEQFFPNVWFISDHGNAHLLSMEPEKPTIRIGAMLRLLAPCRLGKYHDNPIPAGITAEITGRMGNHDTGERNGKWEVTFGDTKYERWYLETLELSTVFSVIG